MIEPKTKYPRPVADLADEIFGRAIEETSFAQALDHKRFQPPTKEEKLSFCRFMGYVPQEEWEALGRPTFPHPLHKGQMDMLECDDRFIIVGGGRRGGKTHGVALIVLCILHLRPYSTIYNVGPTKLLFQKVYYKCLELLDSKGIRYKSRKDPYWEIELENHSLLTSRTLEEPGQMVGDALDFVIIDEAAQGNRSVWDRRLIPSLADKRGGGILIGSYEGNNWYTEMAQEVEIKRASGQEIPWESSWSHFEFASWDNVAIFPLGFEDPVFQAALHDALDPNDFWEQFASRPKANYNLVFPEFERFVHTTTRIGFNKDLPVYIGIDPAGSDAYAVIAFQVIKNCPCWSWYGIPDTPEQEHVWVIDEFYKRNAITEMVIDDIKMRPWFPNLSKLGYGIVDVTEWQGSAYRWGRSGVKIYVVQKTTKDFIKNSLDYYRTWLRDPIRYKFEINRLLVAFAEKQGMEVDAIPVEEYRIMRSQVEQEVPKDILVRCNRVHIDPVMCPNTVYEHVNYQYAEGKRGGILNAPEKPMNAFNHAIDATVYYFWQAQKYGKRPPSKRYIE